HAERLLEVFHDLARGLTHDGHAEQVAGDLEWENFPLLEIFGLERLGDRQLRLQRRCVHGRLRGKTRASWASVVPRMRPNQHAKMELARGVRVTSSRRALEPPDASQTPRPRTV